MLKKRIIPRFLARKSASLGGSNFEACISQNYSSLKMVGALKSQLRIFESNKADELMVINTCKTPGPIDADFVQAISDSIEILSTPIIVGGGINSQADAAALVDIGVEKLLCGISTRNHAFHTKIANLLGSQALSICVDYSVMYESIHVGNSNKFIVTLDSFRTLIERIENSGAGEIILNRIDFDGKKSGLDLEMLHLVLDVTNVPIVLASGAGKAEHFIAAFEAGADGVGTGTFFAKMDQNPLQLRSRLFNAGINIRA